MSIPFSVLFMGWLGGWAIGGAIIILVVCELIVLFIEKVTFEQCDKSPTKHHQYSIHKVMQPSGFILEDHEYRRVQACKHCKHLKRDVDWWDN